MPLGARVRPARVEDCAAIAAIYNEGIADRSSTFETEPRTAADVERWLDPGSLPALVIEREGAVVGWGRLSPYSTRD